MDLVKKKCKPCNKKEPPLKESEVQSLSKSIQGWEVIDQHHLKKSFQFEDFISALVFTNQVGGVAEKENHHPDITLGWGKAEVKICTHAIDGLHENDFILAAKIDEMCA